MALVRRGRLHQCLLENDLYTGGAGAAGASFCNCLRQRDAGPAHGATLSVRAGHRSHRAATGSRPSDAAADPLSPIPANLDRRRGGGAAWEEFLKLLNGSSFNLADPVFGRDVGFYIFSLPFLRILQSFVWWTLIYPAGDSGHPFFDYAISWSEDRVVFAPHVKGHLSVLMGLMMFTLAAGYLLKGYVLMFSSPGVVFGASYTDVHAQLPVLSSWRPWRWPRGALSGQHICAGWKLPVVAIGIIVLTSIFAGRVYPFIVQQYQVSPNELAREEQYIKYNIDFTRKAFDLEPVRDQAFSAVDTLTTTELESNAATANNIRLWEPRTLGQTYNQIQVIRPITVSRMWISTVT